jgi:hypothetical protein
MSNIQQADLAIAPQYFVSELGQIFNVDYHRRGEVREVPYALVDTDCPHVKVSLRGRNGKYSTHYVHNLVALVYGERPKEEGMVVIHKDGNSLNNCTHNLFWATRECESTRKRLLKYSHPSHNVIPVARYDVKGERLETYPSPSDAASAFGISSANIKSACNFSSRGGSLGQGGEHYWKYILPIPWVFGMK